MMGLAWLVRCYDHGINAILADEMVSLQLETAERVQKAQSS
jgi:hypothetical protein